MTDIIGLIGALCYIVAYFLVSFRLLSGSSLSFQTLNLLGAIGVTIAALYNNDKPSIVLNSAWGMIAVFMLFLGIIRRKRSK